MKKIYEHNDKAIKSFIIADHQIDVLESSKKGLLLEINNNKNNSTTTVFIHTRQIKKIIKMIYEHYISIDNKYGDIGWVNGKLYVSHIENTDHLSGKGSFEVWRFNSNEIAIMIFIKGSKSPWCQYIRFKINDILVVENL